MVDRLLQIGHVGIFIMPVLVHGFLTASPLNDGDSFLGKSNTEAVPVAESTSACLSWDSLTMVKDGEVSVIAGFPSTGLIRNALCLEKILSKERVVQIAVSWTHSFYLNEAGQCFSSAKGSGNWIIVRNQDGQTETFVSISSGENHTVGITADRRGCLLQHSSEPGEESLSMVARPLCPAVHIRSVCCGKEHVLLLTSIGVVLTFGTGSRGQLGHGTIDNVESPQVVGQLEGLRMVAIAAGGWHSAALSDLGDVYTWGWNEVGQLGFPCRKIQEAMGQSVDPADFVNVQCVPCVVDLPVTSDNVMVTAVSCGSRHTAVVTDDGQLYTWGWNQYGQLGHGDTLDRDRPTRVHCEGIGQTGVHHGQLGHGDSLDRDRPTRVHYEGTEHTGVHYGQLDHGDSLDRDRPTRVHYEGTEQTGVHSDETVPTDVHFEGDKHTRVHCGETVLAKEHRNRTQHTVVDYNETVPTLQYEDKSDISYQNFKNDIFSNEPAEERVITSTSKYQGEESCDFISEKMDGKNVILVKDQISKSPRYETEQQSGVEITRTESQVGYESSEIKSVLVSTGANSADSSENRGTENSCAEPYRTGDHSLEGELEEVGDSERLSHPENPSEEVSLQIEVLGEDLDVCERNVSTVRLPACSVRTEDESGRFSLKDRCESMDYLVRNVQCGGWSTLVELEDCEK